MVTRQSYTLEEKDVKAATAAEMRNSWRRAVIIRHEDRITSGIPDLSATADKRTLWVEFKFSRNGEFDSKGIQELTMNRLAIYGFAIYVVFWYGNTGEKRTYLVPVSAIGQPMETWTNVIEGFDYKELSKRLQGIHHDSQ